MMIRIADLVQVRTGDKPAWRFALHLDDLMLRECFARRARTGAWAIYGPMRHYHGTTVPLAAFSPALRAAIAAALDATISGEVAA